MLIQVLSDLHLETEQFNAAPAPGADVLVLAGDIDNRWDGLNQFANWPVPVVFVAGNHEFDRREWSEAWVALRQRCQQLGIHMLEKESLVLTGAQGERVRFLGTTRWTDFDLEGPARREKALKAAHYFVRVMKTTVGGELMNAHFVREEALSCRQWLEQQLLEPILFPDRKAWDRTVVITHFGPSRRSADPRYGMQPGTSSFLNDDESLIPMADLWIHGHVHCRHGYEVTHARGSTKVIANPRGHGHKGEPEGYDPLRCVSV